jgi:hypothetical protein
MLDFILVPLVVGICVAGAYGLFELIVRRRERLTIIEKVGEKLDASAFEGASKFNGFFPKISFSALKAGCLLMGVGLGLLVGFVITFFAIGIDFHQGDHNWYYRDITATVYGASVLLFGGVSLIVAFIIETSMSNRERKKERKSE